MRDINNRITPCGVLVKGPLVHSQSQKLNTGCSISCQACMSFSNCVKQRNIDFCYQCTIYPCTKFENLAVKFKQEGIDLKFNQKMIEVMGEEYFIAYTEVHPNSPHKG
ncbi:DUF3795 domain-containing protein [Saprospiraceae bacterium]|nr:DUF3795 domain-containing protein [Saprospiraceae bacterium]